MKYRYYAEADGKEYLIIVDEAPEGLRISMTQRGESEPDNSAAVDFTLAQAPGAYSLLVAGQSVQAQLEPDAEEKNLWHTTVGRLRADVKVRSEREHRLSKIAGPTHSGGGELVVKAPMPGLVRQVMVAAGEQVSKGQRLVVLEAMKMENDIQAPRDGVVKSLHVQSGDTVENARPLVTLE